MACWAGVRTVSFGTMRTPRARHFANKSLTFVRNSGTRSFKLADMRSLHTNVCCHQNHLTFLCFAWIPPRNCNLKLSRLSARSVGKCRIYKDMQGGGGLAVAT